MAKLVWTDMRTCDGQRCCVPVARVWHGPKRSGDSEGRSPDLSGTLASQKKKGYRDG